MNISFDNLDEIRNQVDGKVFNQAVGSTVRQLSDKTATQIAQAVTKKYPVKRSLITQALTKRFDNSSSVPGRLLIYLASRISLRHFATKARPIIKTGRGPRVGAKVKDTKTAPPRLVPGGFFGKGRGSGSEQIFKRKTDASDSPIKKLTGPSVSQLVRGTDVINQVNRFVEENANPLLVKNLDHFQKRRIGVR